MTRPVRYVLTMIFGLGALGIPGCGGSDEATATQTVPLHGEEVVVPQVVVPEASTATVEHHRPEHLVCNQERPRIPVEDRGPHQCSTHEECTEGVNGRCMGRGRQGFQCTYDRCFADSECTAGPCSCDRFGNHCLSGTCQIDADCGASGRCSPSQGSCGDYAGIVAYFCHLPDDECVNDSDCEEHATCRFSEEIGHWACNSANCQG